jgi:hypothetical protein
MAAGLRRSWAGACSAAALSISLMRYSFRSLSVYELLR